MSNRMQSSNHNKEQTAPGRAPLLLPTTAIASSVVPRTLTLIATISLVAFAFYMTRPEADLSSVHTSGHAGQPEAQQTTLPAASPSATTQSQSRSTGSSSSKSTVIVNSKNIPVSDDGSIDQTIQDGGSTTTVHISSDSSGGSSSSSVNIESNSSSSSSGSGT